MIAIDVDSTLYDFESPARNAFFELAEERNDPLLKRGAYQPWHQWRDPTDVCGKETWLEIINRVHAPRVIKEQVPYPDAVSVVNELAKSQEIFYLSARNQAATYEATFSWLKKCGFPEATLVCAEGSKDEHLKHCQYIIDDRPKTLVEFVYDFQWKYKHGQNENKRVGFSLLHPYNESLTDVEGIYLAPSWSGIKHYMKKEGVM